MQPNYWSNPIAAQQAQDAAYNQAQGNPSSNSGNSSNFLERLLPVAGGIGAALLAPETGGASLLADAAIFGAGSGVGKAVENKLSNEPLTQDVAKTALESGGSALAFGGLAKGAGGILSKLSGAGKTATTGTNYARDYAANTAPRLLQNQMQPGINALPSYINPADLTKELSINAGIHDAADIPKVLDIVNKAITPNVGRLASSAVSEGITPATAGKMYAGVNTGGIINMVNDLKNTDMGIGLSSADENKVMRTIEQTVGASSGVEGATNFVKASDAFGAMKSLEKAASAQYSKAYNSYGDIINPSAHSAGQLMNAAHDELEGRIFDNLQVTPQMKSDIINALNPLKDMNPPAYNYYSGLVSRATEGPQLRSILSPLVNGSNVYKAAQSAAGRKAAMGALDLAKNVSPLIGLATMNPLVMGASLLPKVLGSNKADVLAGKFLGNIARGGESAVKEESPSTLSKLTLGASRVGGTLGNLPNLAAPPIANLQSAAPVSNNGGVMNEPNIFTALANPQAVGNQNLAPLGMQALIGMFDPYLLSSSITGPAQTAEQSIQKANVVSALLPTLRAEFGQAGGGQGPISGTFSRLAGALTGGPAANYQGAVGNVANALTSAGIPTSPSTLPQLTQSTQTAADTIQRLQSLLQALGASPAQ